MVIWPVAGVVRVVVQQCLEGHRFTSPGPAQIDLSLVGTWTEDPLRSRGGHSVPLSVPLWREGGM